MIEELVRPNIRSLKAYTSARDLYKSDSYIYLDANENPYGSHNRYPDPYHEKLKDRLSEIKGIDKSQIFCGNGSDEILDYLFRIFCTPAMDKVLTFQPTYGMYQVLADINDIEIVKIPLTKDFQIDLKKTTEVLKDPTIKLIFICSPNNPTANLLQKADIEYLLVHFKGMVIIDEAYIDFAGQAESWIMNIDQYERLVVLQTLSKSWGLAGLRLGCCYANKKIIYYLNKVKAPYNISSLNQEAALDILADTELFDQQLQDIQAQKERLRQQLSTLDFVRKIYPSDTNFLLVEVDEPKDIFDYLVAHNIIIRNRASEVHNCIRISVGTKHENDLLLEHLNTYQNEKNTLS